MPSKLDLLRQGNAIEFEPGLSGRLNKEKKTLELSNGRVLNVANDRDYFPEDQSQVKMSKQREYAEKGAKGPAGEFLHQYTSKGIPGGISDWTSYLTQTGEDYAQRNAANQQVSERISKESPYISGAATGANIATDIALTRGMSGLKAAPLLTLGSAGSRIVTEPENVAGETALSAGLGYGIDKAAGYLGRVAQRRTENRALPGQQQAVRNQNIAGQQAVNEANAQQTQAFNALKQNVKSVNETRLQQHQKDLNARQNQIIQEQNAFEQKKLQRDAEIIRLKNKAEMEKAQRSATAAQSDAEYKSAREAANQENKRMTEKFKLDQEQHKKALEELPLLQKKAQEEYSANVVKNAEGISNAFGKDSKIYSSQFGVNDFIEESIQKSGLAGSREASQGSKILKSLFPEGEILTGKELASRYKSLEGAIQKASPEVRQILNDFKTHMGERLPTILADNMAYTRVFPAPIKNKPNQHGFRQQIEKAVDDILNEMGLIETGIASRSYLKDRANSNLKQLFRELSPQDFMKKMQNGEIRQQILNNVLKPNDFYSGLGNLKNGKKPPISISSDEAARLGIDIPKSENVKFEQFKNLFASKLDNALAKAELKMIATDVDAARKLGSKVKNTYGTAEPVRAPNAPIAPEPLAAPNPPPELPVTNPIEIPPPLSHPVTPPLPQKPNLMGEPSPTIPNTFSPQPEPNLAPPSGSAERLGDSLERPVFERGGVRQQTNNLMKLGGLKYLLGGAALPAEAAYLGMKGLTSPGVGGQVARMTFKQGGIQAIESWAQKYPSYHDGILENPQDRRSLTKEVEDSFDIPIEQKAMIQSKINRGKPIQERL